MYAFDYNNQYLARQYRARLIEGYNEFIRNRIDQGAQAHFINFIFNHIPYGRERRLEMMIDQVTRVHTSLLFHTVRKPKMASWQHLRPVFIGAPDLPVWKHDKVTGRLMNVNGGLHFNVVALTPPPAMATVHIKLQNFLFGKQSRLTVPLEVHFRQRASFYVNETLYRIHVTPIARGTMADYTLKTFKKGLVSSDAIQVWS